MAEQFSTFLRAQIAYDRERQDGRPHVDPLRPPELDPRPYPTMQRLLVDAHVVSTALTRGEVDPNVFVFNPYRRRMGRPKPILAGWGLGTEQIVEEGTITEGILHSDVSIVTQGIRKNRTALLTPNGVSQVVNSSQRYAGPRTSILIDEHEYDGESNPISFNQESRVSQLMHMRVELVARGLSRLVRAYNLDGRDPRPR